MLRVALLPLPLALLMACSAPVPPHDTAPTPASAPTNDTATIATPPSAPAPTGLRVELDRLTGGQWLLTSAATAAQQPIDALFADEETPLQLSFDNGQLQVRGGCNTLTGSYQITQDTLSVNALAATRRACAAPLMQADAAISAQLAAPLQVLAIDGGQLLLVSASGDTLSWRAAPSE